MLRGRSKAHSLRSKSAALAAIKTAPGGGHRPSRASWAAWAASASTGGAEWTAGAFRHYFRDDNKKIAIEFTPPGGLLLKYNGGAESAILFTPGIDERGDRLWMRAAKWACDALSTNRRPRPARAAVCRTGVSQGKRGSFRLFPFFGPGFVNVLSRSKLDDEATLC